MRHIYKSFLSKKELTSGVSSETKFGLLDTGRDSFGCPASLDDLVSVSTGMIMASWPWFSSLIILESRELKNMMSYLQNYTMKYIMDKQG